MPIRYYDPSVIPNRRPADRTIGRYHNPRAMPSAFPVIVKTHASYTAFTYVLTARIQGEERIVSFGSKTLSKQQRKCSAKELEFHALRHAVRANADFLDHCDYVVECDSRPLQSMRRLFSLA